MAAGGGPPAWLGGSPVGRRLLAVLRVVHPFPSALNAALVLGIALIAGRNLPDAALLALAMLGLQFCIGAVNDLFDETLDATSKPHKPIPAGAIDRRGAWVIALASGAGAIVLATWLRWPDAVLPLMTAAMLGAGLAYDAWLKPTGFGWLCFAVAFPILPLYAWYGMTGGLPPGWEILVPVAALSGPALQIANGLVDLESDRAAGVRTLPVLLGRRLSLVAGGVLMLTIHGLAWLTLPHAATDVVRILSGAASATAVAGVAVAAARPPAGALGWSLQAISIALLALAWLLAASLVGG